MEWGEIDSNVENIFVESVATVVLASKEMNVASRDFGRARENVSDSDWKRGTD